MLRFLVHRIFSALIVMWLTTVLVFALFFAAPNNVAQKMAGHNATPTMVELITKRLHLDEPIWQQYLRFLGNLLKGDLGQDYYYQIPVNQMIAQAFPVTASLAIGAAVIWMIIGISTGVLSAVRPRSFLDRFFTVVALIFYSVPVFVLGMTLLYFFYYRLTLAGFAIFPPGGYKPMSEGIGQWFMHLVLTWLSLALISAAFYTRLTRSSMLEVLGEDYIRTARSKGLRERSVIFRHGLRSALTPIVTQFGIDVAVVIGGAVLTETVFSLPGLGRTAIQAITNQDLPVIMGITLVATAAVVIANVIVDLLYAVIDPRVRLT